MRHYAAGRQKSQGNRRVGQEGDGNPGDLEANVAADIAMAQPRRQPCACGLRDRGAGPRAWRS